MKEASEVFKSIRYAKVVQRDKPHKSTDNEEHGTVGEKEYEDQVKHIKKMAGVAEAVKDETDIGEYDQEGDMAKSDLRSIIANAQKLHDMMDDADNLPEWVQSKITKAEDYISTVANYMAAEMNEEVEQIEELSTELLGRYKKAAGDSASAADKAGDMKKGNKRFSGIVKATKKQFDNDMKKEEVEYLEEGYEERKNAPGWHSGSVKNPNFNDELSNRRVNAVGKRLKSGKLSAGEKGSQERLKTLMKFTKSRGGLAGPKSSLPEEVEQLEEKNAPTNPGLWSRAKALARSKFDVYPSAYANGWAAKWYKSKGGDWKTVSEETEQLEEGRPSQRHPLEGHEYHKKTNAELEYIAKDAHKAAEAMKSHNTTAENKYRDQANDSATVRYWRKKNGTPDWYKKKYGHVKEDVEMAEEKDYHSVHVNGRHWKTFDSKAHAENVAKKIKGASVQKYDAERMQRNYAAKSAARNAARGKQWDESVEKTGQITESRKSKIVREAMDSAKKKKMEQKTKNAETFNADPTLSSVIVKEDK